MKKLISILYYLFFTITALFFLPVVVFVWLITWSFDSNLRVLHLFTQYWESFLLFVVPTWRIKVIGKEKIDKKKKYVIVSNHQSEFDILLASKLYTHFKWISKESAFHYPIIGWVMKMNKYIALKRGDKRSIVHMIKECIQNLNQGNSIWIYPEGTRSKTGVLRSFSSGAFVIAKKAKVGILPVVINGTKNIQEKGAWTLNFKAKISIEVLDEIPYEEIKGKTTEELSLIVYNLIAERVEEHIRKKES